MTELRLAAKYGMFLGLLLNLVGLILVLISSPEVGPDGLTHLSILWWVFPAATVALVAIFTRKYCTMTTDNSPRDMILVGVLWGTFSIVVYDLMTMALDTVLIFPAPIRTTVGVLGMALLTAALSSPKSGKKETS